jgi:hypothetical protein
MAGILLPNCTLFKMLDNTYVEYRAALPATFCSDASTDGSTPADGVPHVAQDKGTPWFGGTGNGSYLFYVSGRGKFVHKVFMTKSGSPPIVAVKAQLPAQYDHILGMAQSRHDTPLLVVTTTALFITTAQRSTRLLQSLQALNLTTSTLLTSAAAATGVTSLVFLLDSSMGMLHTLEVDHARADAVSLTTARVPEAVAVIQTLPTGEIVALLGATAPYRLATFTPPPSGSSSAVEFKEVADSAPLPAPPLFSTMGLPTQLFVAEGGATGAEPRMWTFFLTKPDKPGAAWCADVRNVGFQGSAIAAASGGVQYFV